jgi:hypothetical protein
MYQDLKEPGINIHCRDLRRTIIQLAQALWDVVITTYLPCGSSFHSALARFPKHGHLPTTPQMTSAFQL